MPEAKAADPAFDLEQIEKLFLKAKKDGKPYPFAFGLTSKPENCALMVHLRKEPRALKGLVKKENKAVSKVCFGTFTMDGNRVLFAPTKPLKGIVKQLRRRFKDAGIAKYKPFLVDENGGELDEETLPDAAQYDDEDGIVDAPQQAEEAAAPPPPPPLPEADEPDDAELSAVAIKKRLFEARDALASWQGADKDKLVKLIKLSVQLLDAGDLEKADAAVSRVLEQLQGAPEASEEASPAAERAALQERIKALLPQIKGLENEKAQATLRTKMKEVGALLEQGNLDAAGGGLDKIEAALAKLTGQPAQPAETADPLVVWRDAKELIDTDITTLQNTLSNVTDPNVQRIVEFGLNGITEGNQVAMMRTLMAYNASSGAARAAAGQDVLKQVTAYRDFITSNNVIALCEKNPFGVTLNIRAPILSALDRIERVVAA